MKRLLIIRFSALGDVAMLVPIVRDLATAYPSLQITMLSRRQCATLFNRMPDNVHFVGADLKGRHHGITGLNTLLQEIDYRHIDAVADMHHVLRTAYLRLRLRLAGARVARLHKGRFAKWCLIHLRGAKRQPLCPTVTRYQAVLNELGLHTTPVTRHEAPNTASRADIGIAPFAAHKGKIYPVDKMEQVVAGLAAAMVEKGENIYLFGAGEHEKNILDTWQSRYDGVISLVGRETMDTEIDFMRHLRVMLAMDSANMHLASLAGTRVISVWGATHPCAGFLGYGQSEQDCIQRDLPCRPCSIYGNKPCRYHDYRCLDIPPQQIIEKVLSVCQ